MKPERAIPGWHANDIAGVSTRDYRRDAPRGRYGVSYNPDGPGWIAWFRPSGGGFETITVREPTAAAAMKKAVEHEGEAPRAPRAKKAQAPADPDLRKGKEWTFDKGLKALDCSILSIETRDGRSVAVVLIVPRSKWGGKRRTVVYGLQQLADGIKADRDTFGRGPR